jgi:folate-dependent phosphoribosylglycinamide formyltransferase PurN
LSKTAIHHTSQQSSDEIAIAQGCTTDATPRNLSELVTSTLPKIATSHIGAGADLYGPADLTVQIAQKPERPLRVLFLTSIRDVGRDERVGKLRWVKGQNGGRAVTKNVGTIETVLKESLRGGELDGYVEVAGIVSDDMPRDFKFPGSRQRSNYVADPREKGHWIFDRELALPDGSKAVEVCKNIPSDFRACPLRDFKERARRKFYFESSVNDFFDETNADVILSDHYMAMIEYLFDKQHFNLGGRVLNTHPGITHRDNPYRTLGNNPYVAMRDHAQGRAKVNGEYVEIRPHKIGGASFHFLTSSIDGGAVLCDAETTPVYPGEGDTTLAARLYEISKRDVVLAGLKYYASSVFPYVRSLEKLG